MNVIQKFGWIKEQYIFYAVLLLNVVLLFTTKFFPTMDGPAHLYNSNLICHLIKGDSEAINTFFCFNPQLVPNWTSHILLSIVNFALSAWLAEKFLLLVYISGLAISFRLLVRQLNSQNIGLSILIFPFIYSFLFHLGFYNFSLSFIFLFYTLYYFLKNFDNNSIAKYIVLSVLLLATYLTGVLTFGFLGLSLGLITIGSLLNNYHKSFMLADCIRKFIKKLFLLLIVSLPSLLLMLLFYTNIDMSQSTEKYSIDILTSWLNDVRALIVYDYIGEVKITSQYLHIFILIISVSFYIRFKNKPKDNFFSKIKQNDLLLVASLISLVLLYFTPNSSGAGMMSDRYILMFFMLLLIWIAIQEVPKKIIYIVMILVIGLHLGLLFKHINGTIRHLNRDAKEINFASNYIAPNSVVLPINMSDNWIQIHFSNYLGIDKPLVILENYEATIGWFPLKWNTEKMPQVLLGEKSTVSGINWVSNNNSTIKKQIEYVFLYGSINKLDEEKFSELKKLLNKNFSLVYQKDNYIALYKSLIAE